MPAHKNGCFDRSSLEGREYPVQDGWKYQPLTAADQTRIPVIKPQAHTMTTDCQYSQRTKDDPGCMGCIRKWSGP